MKLTKENDDWRKDFFFFFFLFKCLFQNLNKFKELVIEEY